MNAARIEPKAVVAVEFFNVFDILSAHRRHDALQFNVFPLFSALHGQFDLAHQVLMCLAVFRETRISVATQETFFAAKVHVGEFGHASNLLCEPSCTAATRELLSNRIE